jgi:hypothetical protein
MIGVLASLTVPVCAQLSVAERAALLKANLESSQIILRQYQWIETTVVFVGGEEKTRKTQQCYYGADGTVTRMTLSQNQFDSAPVGFFRRRFYERRQEELTDYMQEVVQLVREYVPPRQSLIQAAKEAGDVSIQILVPGQLVRLTFSNYVQFGDSVSIDVNLGTNRPVAGTVSSTVDSDQSSVTLAITFSSLDNGATYVSHAALTSPSHDLTVTVDNSGYVRAGSQSWP